MEGLGLAPSNSVVCYSPLIAVFKFPFLSGTAPSNSVVPPGEYSDQPRSVTVPNPGHMCRANHKLSMKLSFIESFTQLRSQIRFWLVKQISITLPQPRLHVPSQTQTFIRTLNDSFNETFEETFNVAFNETVNIINIMKPNPGHMCRPNHKLSFN